jgi:hypothetical protein
LKYNALSCGYAAHEIFNITSLKEEHMNRGKMVAALAIAVVFGVLAMTVFAQEDIKQSPSCKYCGMRAASTAAWTGRSSIIPEC